MVGKVEDFNKVVKNNFCNYKIIKSLYHNIKGVI